MSEIAKRNREEVLKTISKTEKLATIENLKAGVSAIYFDNECHKLEDIKKLLLQAFPNDKYAMSMVYGFNEDVIIGVSDTNKNYWSTKAPQGAAVINLDYFMDNLKEEKAADSHNDSMSFAAWLNSTPGKRAYSALNILEAHSAYHGQMSGEGKTINVIKRRFVGEPIATVVEVDFGKTSTDLTAYKAQNAKGDVETFETEEELMHFLSHGKRKVKKYDEGTFLVLVSNGCGTFREPKVRRIKGSNSKYIYLKGGPLLDIEQDGRHFTWFATEGEAAAAAEAMTVALVTEDGVAVREGTKVYYIANSGIVEVEASLTLLYDTKYYSTKKAAKAAIVLFNTEDGEVIREGDSVCLIEIGNKDMAVMYDSWISKDMRYSPNEYKYFKHKKNAIAYMREDVVKEARQYRKDLAEMANILTDESLAITLTVGDKTISLCDNESMARHLLTIEDSQAYACIQGVNNKFE